MAKNKSRKKTGTVPILLGIVVLLLPIVLTLANDYQIRQVSEQYAASVKGIQPDRRIQQMLDEAHAYNRRLAQHGHHAMPPNLDSPGFDEYLKTLDAPETHGVMARLRIPSINVDLPVSHTTHSDVLYHGAGHMFGSDLPVGGQGTTAALSAHTGMVNATMFDNLPRIKDGDSIYLEVLGQTLQYKVFDRKIVKPDDTSAITYEPGKDKLVLITCTPYGINTDRLLVEAIRAPMDATSLRDTSRISISWWMWLDFFIIVLVLAWLWWRSRQRRKQRRQKDSPGQNTMTAASKPWLRE